MAEDVLHGAHAAAFHQLPGPLHEGLVVPSVRDQQVEALLPGALDELAGVDGAGRHRLLAHHVQAGVESGQGVLVVQGVGRGHDHSVQLAVGQQVAVVLGGVAEAEALLHLLQLPGAEAADAGEVHVVPGRQDRQVVAGGPPAGADEAESHLLCHGFPPVWG